MTDERYKKIMTDLGMPNSQSLLVALKQVANEAGQECVAAKRRARDCATLIPNAHLISAVPDLLAAGQRLLSIYYNDGIEYTGDHPAAEARRAISKTLNALSEKQAEHKFEGEERRLKCTEKYWFADKECRGEMNTILNIEDHFAFSCECGCVQFYLLKSSLIECSNCGERFGLWKV